jgi:hypothetical protein
MNDIEILIPTAETWINARPLAPRLKQINGARIAWLDNLKANAGELLSEVAKALTLSGHEFELVRASKKATSAAPDDVMAYLKTCDAVVLAIAD